MLPSNSVVVGRLVPGQRDHLRDVHALVAHALHVLDHVQQGRHQAQVAGHRRLERQQRQDALVHLQVAAVDAVVVGDDHRGQLDVAVGDRLQGPVQGLADEVQAAQRLGLELGQLVLEVLAVGPALCHQPTLPVTYASVRGSDGLVKTFSV